MSFITSLISLSSLATWIFLPLNAIFLTLDGIVYSLVAYSYKIFMLIAQLNYNVVYAWVSPLVDRVKAILLVLIMFKVGYALIQYMINPDSLDDTAKGGPALIKNIGIAAVMLILYSFVFSFMNELTLLLIGVPEGYEFTTLKQVADVTYDGNDSGLIARFIFGAEADDTSEFGKKLSVNTLSIFLHSKPGKTSDLDDIYKDLVEGDLASFNGMKIVTIVARIDKDVEYKWPIISTAAGLYLAWQIIKLAVELAIRMFKLLVLQVLAPLAIVSVVDGGIKNNTWSNYTKTYLGIWTDAFIRVGSLYLATALVGQFYSEFDSLVPDAAEGTITKGLILLIILFSAYKCIAIIPDLIKKIFPSLGTGESNAKGFGGLLGGIAGAGFGALTGAATGIIGGAGAAGVIGNIASGGFTGFQSGQKGKNVMDFFSNQAKVTQGNRDRAQRIARQGGGLRYAGAAIEKGLGIPQNQQMRIQRAKDNTTALDNMMKARGEALGALKQKGRVEDSNGYGLEFEFGSTKDETIANAKNATEYKIWENEYRKAYESGDRDTMEASSRKMKEYEDLVGNAYDVAIFDNADVNKDASVKAATSLYDMRAGTGSTEQLRQEVKRVAQGGGKTSSVVKNKRKEYENKARTIENSPSVQRATRQDKFGGK